MSYLLKNSLPKRNQKPNLILIILIFLVVLFFITPFGRRTIRIAFYPFFKSSSVVGRFFADNIYFLNSKKQLIEENLALKLEIKNREKDLKFLSVIEEENQELKKIKENSIYKNYTIASVISRPSKTLYDVLILDVGKADDVSVGDKILSHDNVFIGEIYEVDENISKANLYSTPGKGVSVLVGTSKVERYAFGLGSGNFKIELPNDIFVEIGDSIVLPFLKSNIFGVIERIDQKPTDSFKTVYFKGPVNIQDIRYVEIISLK